MLFTPDDDFNIFGRIFECYLILSAPVAFVINFLSMFRKARSEQTASFRVTRAHALVGSSILVLVLILFSKAVLFPLPGLGREFGEGPVLSQILCLLAFLPLPALFLLGRLPRMTRGRSEGTLVLQPTSINLIIGAALLLVVLMEVSGFVLQAIACPDWGSC